ncbi:MAG: ATP-binding cassette domain-containing protein [Fidelibacterota bacterium]
MNIIFLIAKRFLIPRNMLEGGIINIISFLGLFIGSMSIILSVAVLNGFQGILEDETRKIYGDYAIINFDYNEDRELVEKFEKNGIKYAPYYEEEFFISKNKKQSLVNLKTVDNLRFHNFYDLELIEENKNLNHGEAIIGKSLADKMDLSIGDSISIYSTNLNMSYLAMPSTKELMIKNIFQNRILRSDEFLVFTVSREYSLSNNKFTHIEMIGTIDDIILKENKNIISWKERNRQLFDATEIEKKITFFTLFLIIIVASFNLSSSVMQIATKKTREMAILSTFGMSKNSISSIFLVYGYLLATSAIVSGILFALLIICIQNTFGVFVLNPEFYLVSILPMEISVKDISLLLFYSMIIIGLFATLPLMLIKKIREVLKGVSFNLHKGDILTIKGPSGSGKSTLLSLIGTLDQPDSGEIIINQKNLKDIKNYDLIRNTHIGFIFQFHNLIAELNVVENVTIPTLIAGKKIDTDYVDELFEYFDLSNRKKSFPLDLSGGEKQRVSAMRAIINKPSIVIADEPTGNLDEHNAIKMIDLFQKLNQDFNLTFVIATHDEKVFNIGSKKTNLYDGNLLEL